MANVRTPSLADFDFEVLDVDPYPSYAKWRLENPVAYVPEIDGWLVTSWDECSHIGNLKDEIDSHSDRSVAFFGPNILNESGRAHLWLRAGVDPPFRPRIVKSYVDSTIRSVAQTYVNEIRPLGKADACVDLLEMISVRVVGNILGLRDVDDERLQWWFTQLNIGLTDVTNDPDVLSRVSAAMADLDAYMEEAVNRLTVHPDESGLSSMIHTGNDDRGPRTYEELIGTIRVLILGGFQEPGHAAAASLLGLLQDSQQMHAVRSAPDEYIPLAVLEGMRWISPFGMVQRRALKDIDVHGVVIPAGDEIQLCVGSANRDGKYFERPDVFNIFRTKKPIAAFGYGLHYCSGHFLARELEVAMLHEMFKQLDNLRLDPDGEPNIRGVFVRGVRHLPVVWNP